MKPKDFAKKKFKLIPGADYGTGPIRPGTTLQGLLNLKKQPIQGPRTNPHTLESGEITPSYLEFDAITAPIGASFSAIPVAGMFVPVSRGIKGVIHKLATKKTKPQEVNMDQMKGIFSDVNSKVPMRWIDDSKMHLYSPEEIAGKLRKKYYPEHLEQSNFDHPVDWEEAVSAELSALNRKRIDLEEHGPVADLTDVNQRLAWIEDPKFEMDWAMQTDGRNIYRLDQIMDHPELFKEQPHLRDVKVDYNLDGATMGNFSSKFNTMGLNRNYGDDTARKVFGRDNEKGTILHEIQHSIQNEAGWPRGGNVEEFKTAYRRNRKRMTKIIANLESKEMLGDPFDKELLERTRKAYDNLQTPFDKYRSLHGEQQARAVQEMFKNPERFKYSAKTGKRAIPQTPYSTLKVSEGVLPEPLLRYGAFKFPTIGNNK